MMEEIKLNVRLSALARMVERLEDYAKGTNPDISFEFIVGSLFPNAMENMKTALFQAHEQGFLEGKRRTESKLLEYATKTRDLDKLIVLLSEKEDKIKKVN
jgi:hypothetical protein